MKQFIQQIYNSEKQKGKFVIFLDRDGTLIKHIPYLSQEHQISLLPGVIEGLHLLQEHKFLLIVITNQPVIAKGIVTTDQVKKINDLLAGMLKKQGIYLHAIYSCPHHPHATVEKYRMECLCRKPMTGMFLGAIKKYAPDLSGSVMIGDTMRDIDSGKRLGLFTCLVNRQEKDREILPDINAPDFITCVRIILSRIPVSGKNVQTPKQPAVHIKI